MIFFPSFLERVSFLTSFVLFINRKIAKATCISDTLGRRKVHFELIVVCWSSEELPYLLLHSNCLLVQNREVTGKD